MKSIIYSITALILFSVVSCKKETVTVAAEQKIIGKWKFEQLTGGVTGMNVVADPTQVDVIEFKADGTFIRSTNGEQTSTGKYEIFQDVSIFTSKRADILKYIPQHGQPSVVTVDATMLLLSENVTDGFNIRYSKVKQI